MTQNTITGSVKIETYEINPAILNHPLGYSARIDGDNIKIVAHLYGEGYNSNNERINLIKEPGFVLVNGERTKSGKFEDLSDKQLYQLVVSGVVLLSEAQQEDFRRKFFGLNKSAGESKKK
jgi:hypothetical protein